MERRNFLKSAAVAGVGAVAVNASLGQSPATVPRADAAPRPMSPDMQYRELGKTREKVSVIGLGGYHIGKQQDAEESIRLIRAAIDGGITFLDNCWDYNDGLSEGADGSCAPRWLSRKSLSHDKDGWADQGLV